MKGIFISHTQTDRLLAEALSSLIRNLFGKKVGVNHNVWTNATGLSAAVVLGDEKNVEGFLAELRRLRPSREQRDSIVRGLEAVLKATSGDAKLTEKVRRLSADGEEP